jgi:effector-binding domain-containing protein
MLLIEPPRIERFAEIPTLGIRTITPFRGMLATRDQLLGELRPWLRVHPADTSGYGYLRLHTVDMGGLMDLEVGTVCRVRLPGDDRVRPGSFRAGPYATLTYQDHAVRANRTLLEWISVNGLSLDKTIETDGDHFACRYEEYLTDPATEPRKTRWHVRLAMRLRDID